ncbi:MULTISPECIES: hypothetical protein [unclassified Vibrio]|uniref:hypothetical protein n=1 Tax=unclassified Vibrio TaxID=2614977 RepID=UPI0012681893|nr:MULTISPECIES: hypothetical protein [unclassified Vibrio]QFT40050.1 hypothetical protein FIU99_27040 [Vibrio sp. THAF64]QGM37995.1 hypothetical protein GGC04_27245 [Vibrio sp. THAF191d]QGN73425.1 hypothetical protein GGC03_26930 [Vibrio sp. THAF191c]
MLFNYAPRHVLIVTFTCRGVQHRITDVHSQINEKLPLKPQLPPLCASAAEIEDVSLINDIRVIKYVRLPKVKPPKPRKFPLNGEWWFCATDKIGERVLLFRKDNMWVSDTLATEDLAAHMKVRPQERLYTEREIKDLTLELTIAKNINTKLRKRLEFHHLPIDNAPKITGHAGKQEPQSRSLVGSNGESPVDHKTLGQRMRQRIVKLFN